MKISVVVTLYNLENYIGEALDSVFRQTRLPDEVIVADDCSTDGSAKVVQQYGGQVTYIRQPQNAGALKNTFSGLKAATGDIVAFLDGDDVWMEEKLAEVEKQFCSDDKIVLVSHDFVRVDENLADLHFLDETNVNTRRITGRLKKDDWSQAFREAILLRRGFWLGSAYAVRRSAVDVERFETLLHQIGDSRLSYLDMTLGPFVVASNPEGKVGFVNKVLFKYRAHGNNSWRSPTKERALKNIARWQNVNGSTFRIINRVLQDKKVEERYSFLHHELELQRLQYENKKLKAILKFIQMVPSLTKEKKLLVEGKRLMATTLLGANTIFKLRTYKKQA